ncbi:MAG: hypothetical protein CMI31_03855 [Opitutae bacterium]|nr:hypothetical protein [Opitutae bacterium]|tara:strand:- start:439 stop:1218 length:780 start_codon:yes stop_codon:yes gene_type:complete
MKSGIITYLGAFFFAFVSLMAEKEEEPANLPFAPGEKLIFQLKWGFFSVGNAVLETHDPEEVNGTKCHKISLTVSTNKFADSIYKVRTKAVSFVEEGFGRSILFQKSQREGKTNRNVEVRFDYKKNIAIYSNHGVTNEPLKIPDQVFDPLAIAYLFRLGDVTVGKDRKLPTCDGKRVQEVVVKVGEKKQISTPSGKYQANEVSPSLENLRGVFKKSPGGYLRIWYSTDKRRMPVRMQSKVVVGSFVAKLKEARCPPVPK